MKSDCSALYKEGSSLELPYIVHPHTPSEMVRILVEFRDSTAVGLQRYALCEQDPALMEQLYNNGIDELIRSVLDAHSNNEPLRPEHVSAFEAILAPYRITLTQRPGSSVNIKRIRTICAALQHKLRDILALWDGAAMRTS